MIREKYSTSLVDKIVAQINTQQTLIVTMGVPGSGKSYIANQIAEKAHNCVRINMDDIMEKLYGTADVQDWRNVTRMQKEHGYSNNVVKNTARDMVRDALSKGYSVVYDATNLRYDARVKTVRSLKRGAPQTVKTLGIIIKVRLSTAKQRNAGRDRKVQDWVIRNMYNTAQLPNDNSSEFDALVLIDND